MVTPHDLTAHFVWPKDPTPGSLPADVLPGSALNGPPPQPRPPTSFGNSDWLSVGEEGAGHAEGVRAAATNMSN